MVVRALRAVLGLVLAGTAALQLGLLWVLISGNDPEDGSATLTAVRLITLVGLITVQVAVVCVWQLLALVRRGRVFSDAAFRYVDGVIGAIVAAALVWFAITGVNAPDQRDDPGVSLIMAGIGVGILGIALLVYVLRQLLVQAVARDAEASELQAELDQVI